jgi:chitinase
MTTLPSSPADWRVGQAYAVGTLVSYRGGTYRALQAATAIETWNPLDAPALWEMLAAGSAPPPDPAPPSPPAPPASGWSASTVYTQGMTVTIDGVTYRANWWTQGNDPARHSGPGGSGQPWTVLAAAPPPPPVPDPPAPPEPPPTAPGTWLATSVYTAGMTVTAGGLTYRANWWTRGDDPTGQSGPAGSGKPWTLVAGGTPAPVAPAVPTGLVGTAASAHTALLTWQPVAGATGYAIFADGARIGQTSATSFTASGLTAATTYRFAIVAENAAGQSARGAEVAVTTRPGTLPDPTAAREFAPYIDLSLYTSQHLAAIQEASGIMRFTLAFVLDSGGGQVGWGGIGSITADTFPNGTSVQSQIQTIRAAGADVIISFGGANGTEPALVTPDAATLQARYQSVIDRYQVTSLDFDIEGGAVANQAALTLRDQALIGLKAANPGLTISFTLPVLPTGLDHHGLNVLRTAQRDGLTPDVVNIMAMDYGPAVNNGGQMGANAISAALNTIEQMRFIGLDSKLGITPMIGVNDVAGEVFTLADAQSLVDFARDNPAIERLSMWSVSRDNGSTAGSPWASPTGSGLVQDDYAFARIFQQF